MSCGGGGLGRREGTVGLDGGVNGDISGGV